MAKKKGSVEQFESAKELFVVVCLHFFQGQEQQLMSILRDDNIKNCKEMCGDKCIKPCREFTLRINKLFKNKKGTKKEKSFFCKIFFHICHYRKIIHAHNSDKDVAMEKMKESSNKRKQCLENIQLTISTYFEGNRDYWDETSGSNLFSRNQFKEIEPKNYLDFLVAICLYLLRGYCIFWTKEYPSKRILNWTHHSLGDITQAYYLACGLYNNIYGLLGCENDKSDDYLKKLQKLSCFDKCFAKNQKRDILLESIRAMSLKDSLDKKGLVVWWLLLFVDVFAGNVYKKAYDDDAAFDYYCRVIRNFDKLSSKQVISSLIVVVLKKKGSSNEKAKAKARLLCRATHFCCKTIVKARFEKAKIFFDQGFFLESLKWHFRALMDILLISWVKEQKDSRLEQYHKFEKIIKYLDHEKERSIFNKEVLLSLMKSEVVAGLRMEGEWRKLIDSDYWYLVSDILPRVGFVLYTLKVNDGDVANLDIFFEPEKIFSKESKNSFASYCSMVLLGDDTSNYGDFVNMPERIFSAKVLRLIKKEKGTEPDSNLEYIARQLSITSMKNIDNFVTIPKKLNSFLMRRGYITGIHSFRSEPSVTNKIVVLRRWQSTNPIIPRPHATHLMGNKVPGGGYLLIWESKGIVIDPGFNFIQNLYDEGFSIEDIDAVIITHAHIDHDNELSSILTLLYEWNIYWEERGKKDLVKKIDLFLNEGSYRKFHSWLYSPTKVVDKIYQLQLNVDIGDGREKISNRRGENMHIDLNDLNGGYSMSIDVVPAVHDEIIAKNSAIGLKLRLRRKGNSKDKNGIKGRKEFILGITGDTHGYDGIADNYKSCDILIAHLGDIKFRELKSILDFSFNNKDLNSFLPHDVDKIKDFIATLGLVEKGVIGGNKYSEIVKALKCALSDDDYKYPNHLGVSGVCSLHKAMCSFGKVDGHKRLMIIGELPEELASYRHKLASLLDTQLYKNVKVNGESKDVNAKEVVRCLTGDIGLHVEIDSKKDADIKVRCYRCNQNNEMVLDKKHYHPIENIQEVCVKKAAGSMVYLCRGGNCEHHIDPPDNPKYFLNNPYPH